MLKNIHLISKKYLFKIFLIIFSIFSFFGCLNVSAKCRPQVFEIYTASTYYNDLMQYDNAILFISYIDDMNNTCDVVGIGYDGEYIPITLFKDNGVSRSWIYPDTSLKGTKNYYQDLDYNNGSLSGVITYGQKGDFNCQGTVTMYVLKGNVKIDDEEIQNSNGNIIFPEVGDKLSKDKITNFEFNDFESHFYTPSNNSTVNFHYKDKYFWKFDARLYVKFDGDMFITDKKVMEMLISKLELSSPFELYNPVGTYVERPSVTNGFKAKAYIDFKIGFPSDFDFGEYILTASFPGSGTTQSPDIKPATVKINLTIDGSKQEAVFDSSGNVENIENGSSSDEVLSNFPNAPGSDGSVVDWFKYIGDIVIWLVTYPFRLLSDVFNLLGTYINSMMLELEETARAINGLLTFIPGDILNVAYGFIAFTLLYSIVRGVIKLIRG